MIEEGERMLGATATLRCFLQGGLHVLLSRIEEKRFGPLKGKRRKRTILTAKSSPQRNLGIISVSTTSDTGLLLKSRIGRESWLGLCGDDRVIWMVDGERIPNEVIAWTNGKTCFLDVIFPAIRASIRVSARRAIKEDNNASYSTSDNERTDSKRGLKAN